jgi:hypothetical protein
LEACWSTDRFGAPLVVAGGGAGCALAALVFARQLPRLRAAAEPILLARGVIGAAHPAQSVGVRD